MEIEPTNFETTYERTYYDDGQIRSERPYVNGKVHGVFRLWHENGVLRQELPYVEDVFHGLMRRWGRDGRLKRECNFEHGSGVSRGYYPNGQLSSELPVRDNNYPHGIQRLWSPTGELLLEHFYTRQGRVSKKRYIEACKTDPTLPPYDAKSVAVPPMDQTEELAVAHHLDSLDEYPDARDALEWLRGVREESDRRLGELPSAEYSIERVNEYLVAGAKRVYAVNIVVDDDGSENTGELVVELPGPRAKNKREQALGFCNEQNRSLGFSPIADTGQKVCARLLGLTAMLAITHRAGSD
jgi:hypothetical protein